MTATPRDVSYRQLTGQLTGKAGLTVEDEGHLLLRVALYGGGAGVSANGALLAHRLAALDRFVSRTGHARVPILHVEGDVPLGRLVSMWRTEFQVGRLASGTSAELMSRAGWVWSAHQYATEQNLAALDRFVARTGHARVPRSHWEDDRALGETVRGWRKDYDGGELVAGMIAALESRSGWAWDAHRFVVDSKLAALDRFVGLMGHARVPKSYIDGEIAVGEAVKQWRKDFKTGRLSPELARRLESRAGWVWSVRAHSADTYLAALDQFVNERGHARVPRHFIGGGVPLGEAAHHWRRLYKARKLSTEMAVALKARPGWVWSTRSAS